MRERHLEKGGAGALIVPDNATEWIGRDPSSTKSTDGIKTGLMHIAWSAATVPRTYSDGHGEYASAPRDQSWRDDTSTPHRPQPNGVAEQAVRRALGGRYQGFCNRGAAFFVRYLAGVLLNEKHR